MASVFAHAVAGASLWPLFRTARAPRHSWLAGAVLATLPDLDVIGLRLGIPYGAPLGHRGLTHSLVVAAIVGAGIAWALSHAWQERHDRLCLAGYFVLALASHGLLDAMTTGGLGVALLAPLDSTRYFFPWRPIAVSPIGFRRFFTPHGFAVLANEAMWVGLPSLLLAVFGFVVRRPGRHDDQPLRTDS